MPFNRTLFFAFFAPGAVIKFVSYIVSLDLMFFLMFFFGGLYVLVKEPAKDLHQLEAELGVDLGILTHLVQEALELVESVLMDLIVGEGQGLRHLYKLESLEL
jgi:hypothetical protein